ncbi:hypothetical protein ACFSUK_17095 [Sphingobium scionense]
MLHLSGEAVAPMDAEPLQVTRLPVYRMKPLPCDPPELSGGVLLVHSLPPVPGWPRFSRKSARDDRYRRDKPAALAACGSGWASAQAADAPNDAAVLALARRLCE